MTLMILWIPIGVTPCSVYCHVQVPSDPMSVKAIQVSRSFPRKLQNDNFMEFCLFNLPYIQSGFVAGNSLKSLFILFGTTLPVEGSTPCKRTTTVCCEKMTCNLGHKQCTHMAGGLDIPGLPPPPKCTLDHSSKGQSHIQCTHIWHLGGRDYHWSARRSWAQCRCRYIEGASISVLQQLVKECCDGQEDSSIQLLQPKQRQGLAVPNWPFGLSCKMHAQQVDLVMVNIYIQPDL